MKVLIACEESQVVCKAFRELGHEAYSCDLIECSGGHPEWHIQDDVRNVLAHDLLCACTTYHHFDMVIAHPPCTYLTVSNNKSMTHGCSKYTKEEAQELRRDAVDFFMFFTQLNNKYVAIENPIGIMSSLYRKPDQVIQPWMFGHGETKATCLWLKGLPKLIPTDIVAGREQRIWKLPPGEERAKLRSKTYEGIAKAMAEQWTKPFPPQLTLI